MTDDSARIVSLELDQKSIVRWSPEVEHERNVAIFDLLESNHFKLVGDFEARVEEPPSLRECEGLVVRGDVTFGPGVVVRGRVEVDAAHGAVRLADQTLEG